ncbi:putative retroelement [Phytophthora cinnamomi]|uniref:putative retroelement n=1 Tax=Phytophthora cinnamomi TaxID=4785 RepID=UPI00355A4188|nr:putative retroelement [Phytophthora cinnamomi]
MVWGAIGVKGKSEPVVLEGRQKSSDYICTVSENLLPFAHENYGMDYVFMPDNAYIHASYHTMDLFKEEGVPALDCPGRSPDPHKNVWVILARKVYGNGKQYTPVVELLNLLNSMAARFFESTSPHFSSLYFA